jgi:uncharacterized membrane protein YphA (DoxX/SURF4 family)
MRIECRAEALRGAHGSEAAIAGSDAMFGQMGLKPQAALVVTTVVVQIIVTALVIWGRYVWSGAAALVVFTLLTLPIVWLPLMDFPASVPVVVTNWIYAIENIDWNVEPVPILCE